MKIATSDLRMSNGVLCYAAGSEVPDEALASPLAREYGWPEMVANPGTKAAESAAQPAPGTPQVPAQPAKGK